MSEHRPLGERVAVRLPHHIAMRLKAMADRETIAISTLARQLIMRALLQAEEREAGR